MIHCRASAAPLILSTIHYSLIEFLTPVKYTLVEENMLLLLWFLLFLPTITEFTELSKNFIWLAPDTSLPVLFLVKSYSLYRSVDFLCKSQLKIDKMGKYTIFLPCIYFVSLALPMLLQYYLLWFVVHHNQYVVNMTYRITFHKSNISYFFFIHQW